MEVLARRWPDTDTLGAIQPLPTAAGFAKNAFLVTVSIAFLPLSTSVLVFSYAYGILVPQNTLRRKIRSSPRFRPKIVLITGVSTAKGLRIARAFYEAGHKVIGADFQPLRIPACGRFSRALSAYYALRMPNASSGATLYMRDLIKIVEEEHVQLWVSCSELVSPTDDGQARQLLEHRTNCRTLQVNAETASKIQDTDEFVRYTRSMGMPAPEVHKVQSRAAVHHILSEANGSKRYLLKPVGKTRSSGMNPRTMLPRRTVSQTYQHVSSIKVSKDEPWILQQYVTGDEYHTCSIIVDGELKAFVACPAAHLALNYQALPTDTGIGKAMLHFTQAFIAKAGLSYTGHLSFTFLVEEKATETGIQQNIMPIACSPQADTALVLFARTIGSVDLVRAYLSALAPSAEGINGYSGLAHPTYGVGGTSVPHPNAPGVYFIGQDLVLQVLIPLLQLLTFRMGFLQFIQNCVAFVNHVVFWREGTYELWDPLPWFWLYHVYMPVQALFCAWKGKNWKRADVSTLEILYEY